MPPGGWSRGLAEPAARSVQEISDRGHRVTFTWFDPPFRPEPPHSNQAYGICFTDAGMIVLGAYDGDGERVRNGRQAAGMSSASAAGKGERAEAGGRCQDRGQRRGGTQERG